MPRYRLDLSLTFSADSHAEAHLLLMVAKQALPDLLKTEPGLQKSLDKLQPGVTLSPLAELPPEGDAR